jgi:MATE family multidrug resistance protein
VHSTRVSNELGAGRPQAARLAARVVRFLPVCLGVSEGLVVVLVRSIWGHAYSNDKEVTKYTTRMMPLVAASIMLDCQQSALSGNKKEK